MCLWAGFPHTNTSQREHKRDGAARGSSGVGPSEPPMVPVLLMLWVMVTTRSQWLCPWPKSVPSKCHSLLLPFLLLTVNVDVSTSGAGKDSGPLWILQHLPAWRGRESSRRVTRCPGNRVGGLISRHRSSVCSFAATRERFRSWLSASSLLQREEGHGNITHGQQKPLTLLI